MKTITFLRHSKSSWDYNVLDIDRPLSEFGIEKIKKIAILSKDQFISTEKNKLAIRLIKLNIPNTFTWFFVNSTRRNYTH